MNKKIIRTTDAKVQAGVSFEVKVVASKMAIFIIDIMQVLVNLFITC